MNLPAALLCLTQAIFFEARGEPFIGKVAVASVVMNRVADPRFPDNICDVVKQGPTYKTRPSIPVRHRCQFSFYCDGKSDEMDMGRESAVTSLSVALAMLQGKVFDVTEGATFYHATYVSPSWVSAKIRTVQIDNHIFYRWK
jgi:N-acetylmuramoyl-L-alanine amidase